MEMYWEIKSHELPENVADTILSVVEKVYPDRDKHKELLQEILIQTLEAMHSIEIDEAIEQEF